MIILSLVLVMQYANFQTEHKKNSLQKQAVFIKSEILFTKYLYFLVLFQSLQTKL